MIKVIRHGISLLHSAVRDVHAKKKRSSKWKSVRDDFLLKNNECAVCSSKTRLQVHHKLPFDDYPELELDINNLITLCMSMKECHLRIGHGGSYTKYSKNIDQYIEDIKLNKKTFEEIWKVAKLERLDKRFN